MARRSLGCHTHAGRFKPARPPMAGDEAVTKQAELKCAGFYRNARLKRQAANLVHT